jgi:DNA-binding NtrC family response regulator
MLNNVLIVGDKKFANDLIGNVFMGLNCAITILEDMREAFKTAAEGGVSMIMVDNGFLNGESGRILLELREIGNETPVVIVKDTQENEDGFISHSKYKNAYFVSRPVSNEHIRTTLQSILGAKK